MSVTQALGVSGMVVGDIAIRLEKVGVVPLDSTELVGINRPNMGKHIVALAAEVQGMMIDNEQVGWVFDEGRVAYALYRKDNSGVTAAVAKKILGAYRP